MDFLTLQMMMLGDDTEGWAQNQQDITSDEQLSLCESDCNVVQDLWFRSKSEISLQSLSPSRRAPRLGEDWSKLTQRQILPGRAESDAASGSCDDSSQYRQLFLLLLDVRPVQPDPQSRTTL